MIAQRSGFTVDFLMERNTDCISVVFRGYDTRNYQIERVPAPQIDRYFTPGTPCATDIAIYTFIQVTGIRAGGLNARAARKEVEL